MNEIYIRVLVAVVLASVGFGSGWKVATWRAEASSAADARQYAAGLAAAEDKRHDQEQAALSKQASIEASYLTKLREHDNVAQKTIADLRAGRISMRGPACQDGNNAVPGSTAATPASNGESSADFLKRLYEDVAVRLARCDDTAVTLDLAQQVILNDRK